MTEADHVETIQLRGADGIRLTADVAGASDRPPVLLWHGGGQTRHAWGSALQAVAQQWHGYSIDLRGHGDSEWAANGEYTLDAFAGDVASVASSFSTPPVLVGASLGGIASLAAIADHQGPPLASALVLVDVAPRVEASGVNRISAFMTSNLDGFDSLEEVADLIAAYNPHRPRPSNLEGLKKNLRRRADGKWMWHWDPRFVSGTFGSPDETRSSLVEGSRLGEAARRITVPTLLVRGRMSDLLSEQGAQELLELVPQAELVDVAGAGHMVAGDRNDAFNDAVIDFLERVRPS
ncbi:MAG TPA: alpha/beta hydrolase [Acidimicrobiia bacterium]|nr:alpha/beta hydrolase [Acidimicrobiia bacterium]